MQQIPYFILQNVVLRFEFLNNVVKPDAALDLHRSLLDFDLGRWLMADEVVRVYTEGGTLAFPELNTVGDIDNAVVNMLFERGGLGNVQVSRNALYGYDIRAETLGTEGEVRAL